MISLSNFQADCEWTIMTTTVFKNHQISFKLNETKNDITMDGRGINFVMTQQKSNQWIEIQNRDKYFPRKSKLFRNRLENFETFPNLKKKF